MEHNYILDIKRLNKVYGEGKYLHSVLENINFSVESGEFIGIMGPSGSGKTTLLNVIGTIDTVTQGEIVIDNQDIVTLKTNKMAQFRRENLGFIFQEYNLINTLSVEENIKLALVINGIKEKQHIKDTIDNISRKLEIRDILYKYPYQISGGQKQRVACARAMVNNPKLILADEPTGALDSNSARNFLKLLEKLNDENGTTILMVTHDAVSASYCNRIIFLKDGKVFNEIRKKEDGQFFDEILKNIALMGREGQDVS